VRRTYVAVCITALVSGAATVIVALVPGPHFRYHWPALHVALESGASLIALLAAFLVVGRLRRCPWLDELILACALAVLALSNLFFVTVPSMLSPGPRQLTSWASLAGSLIGALLFTLAAFVPRRRLSGPRLALAAGAAGVIAAGMLAAATTRVFAERSPLRLVTAPEAARLHAYPVPPAVQLIAAVAYGLAVAGYFRRSRQLNDEFLGWLGLAAVLAAASGVNYFLYPALDYGSAWLAEAFRLSFYAVLLVGSMREIFSYWSALSNAAVAEERRRIARDLHDGLAQELAYLSRNLDSVGGSTDQETLGRLRRAVERAQLESRRAVRALAAPAGQALDVALAEAAGELAHRFHLEVEYDFAYNVRLTAASEEALVRIACEAVTNAARHSGAHRVCLSLTRDGPHVRLRVSDTGCGFDPTGRKGGFGLISMRERAQSVGGELRISSSPGCGTDVEAALLVAGRICSACWWPTITRPPATTCAGRWTSTHGSRCAPPPPTRSRRCTLPWPSGRISACSTCACPAAAWPRPGKSRPGSRRPRSSC
jgi:signal transduction histidine kinase